MADESKIQFDIELNGTSVESSFKSIDERATKSAKESAAVFGAEFQRMENELKDSIARIVKTTSETSKKSARESAKAFELEFKKQDEIYKASVKNSLDQAINAITGGNRVKKSAQESAAVFSQGFEDGILKDNLSTRISNFFSRGFKIDGLADLAGGLFLVQQAANAAQAGLQLAIDTIVTGEAEIKLDKKFRELARDAGVAADVLERDLIKATRGLVDEGKLLELASESFIQIGSNARELPKIVELARKSYNTFGGDIVANVEKINQAIFTGNTRSLRQIGILVDSERTLRNYAASLGTVVPLLTEQQRQSAILNEVLRTGQDRFKNISDETGIVTESLKRLNVQATDVKDTFASLIALKFGSLISRGIDSVTSSFQSLGRIFKQSVADSMPEGLDRAQTQVKILSESIAEGEKLLASYGKTEMRTLGATVQEGIARKKELLAEYTKQIEDAAKAQGNLNSVEQNQTATGPDTTDIEYIRRREGLLAKVQDINAQVLASDVQLAQEQFKRQNTVANSENLVLLQRQQANTQYLQQKEQLERFFATNGITDETLRQQAREELQQLHVNRLNSINMNHAEQMRRGTFMVTEDQVTMGNAWENIVQGMKANAEDLRKNFQKTFQQIGASARDGLGNAIGQGFAQFGAALVNGENALEAFAKAFIGSIGQMAIQSGTRFILEGLAYMSNPYTASIGASMVATGATLAAFGGAIAAFAGATSSGPGATAGGGATGAGYGGGFDSGPSLTDIAPQDLEPQTPKTEINLTINGNILDRRETGLEIAQILEEQFGDQGLVLRGV